MKVYNCKDDVKRVFFRVEIALTKHQIADWIAFDTTRDGKHIVKHQLKSVTDEEGVHSIEDNITTLWTKNALTKEIKSIARTFGNTYEGIEYEKEQYEQAVKIVEKFFPEFKESD